MRDCKGDGIDLEGRTGIKSAKREDETKKMNKQGGTWRCALRRDKCTGFHRRGEAYGKKNGRTGGLRAAGRRSKEFEIFSRAFLACAGHVLRTATLAVQRELGCSWKAATGSQLLRGSNLEPAL